MMTPLLRITTALARAVGDKPITPVDLQRVSDFGAVAKKFVACTASKDALLAAWHELPVALQQRPSFVSESRSSTRRSKAVTGIVPARGRIGRIRRRGRAEFPALHLHRREWP
jgi:hypothetical protein